ncbi:MAG: site-specific integrase, partial [Erysipelotrichaceae bacterium]|nr:site-specific integrase [Erysipelotrichaceae bacterium]
MELLEAYQEYTTDITINKGMSQRTISSYCNDLKQYIAWLQKHDVTDTDDIQSTHIEDFLHEES